jgi:hypothetical protein
MRKILLLAAVEARQRAQQRQNEIREAQRPKYERPKYERPELSLHRLLRPPEGKPE